MVGSTRRDASEFTGDPIRRDPHQEVASAGAALPAPCRRFDETAREGAWPQVRLVAGVVTSIRNVHSHLVNRRRRPYDRGMAALLREIIVDCNDPRVVADFWGQLLDWAVQEDDGLLWMSASCRPFPDLVLVFVPVPERKSVKNRIHLDVTPVGCDQQEEVARIMALGAHPVDVGQGESSWVVLADPEGNEFCVLSRRADVAQGI
jgi:hypothetical protein